MLVLRDGATLTTDDFETDALDDLLRAAVTFGVSALDRYVHERTIKKFVQAFRARKLTKQQKEFELPATLAMAIVERVRAARASGEMVRPANEIRKVVQQTLHKRPFQSWRDLEYGFGLIGVKDLGKGLRDAHALTTAQTDALSADLNKIVARRNQIVHEGDLRRHARGGNVDAQSISRQWVSDSLAFLQDFVARLQAVG